MSIFDQPLYIVAEVANAAQGLVEDNHRIIEAAATTAADAVKFQFYKYDVLAVPSYSKYENLKKTFYTAEQRAGFVEKAKEADLDVWVDVFDRWGLDVARQNLDKIDVVKIPPAVILDEALVSDIMHLNLPTVIGVGGYEDGDIDYVLSIIRRFSNPILLMYGFQAFPTPIEDTTLSRIRHLKEKYGYPIGFADHVEGGTDMSFRLPEYAFFAGATFIEKHITLERAAKGLDYYSSLEPEEFGKMVDNLNRCEKILGNLAITDVQKDYLKHATRITTTRPVKSGEIISEDCISFRRTDNREALFPNETSCYFPAISLRDLSADSGISRSDIRKAVSGTVVLCRLNSKRLPRKALQELHNVPAIERCLLNTLASRKSAMTILATSTHPEDEELKNYTLNGKVKFYRGSEEDVAERIMDAARHYGLDVVIRVTGDSPLISYELIDYLLESHLRRGADYSFFKDAPLGSKPEVITVKALKKMKSLIETDGYSEYLSLYFKNNPDHFQLNSVSAPKEFQCPQYRLNLDYTEDYEVLKSIFKGLDVGREAVSLCSVIDYLRNHPELAKINASIEPKYIGGELAERLSKVTRIKDEEYG